MVDVPGAPQAPTPNDAVPPNLPDPDSQQWADLAKELDAEEEALPEEAPVEEPPKPEGEEAPPEPDKPKLSYEQLESNYRNAQGAFKSEREGRRRAEESLQAVNKLIDDLRAARARPAQPEPEMPKVPDVHEDPIGHFQARTAILEQALLQTHQGQQATQQHLQAQAQEEQFWNHVRASENEFRKTTADYDAACEHLKAHR